MEIFISYAHEDFTLAKQLYDSLKRRGASIWLDKISLLPGQVWETEIKNTIRKANFVVLLMSNNAIDKRGFFQKEIQIAIDVYKTVPSGQIYLIPARLDECNMPEFLQEVQWVDLFPDWDTGMELIRRSIYVQRTKDIVTSSIEGQAPAPDDVIVMEPAPEIENPLRSFSGCWTGRWGGVLPSQLIVERIDKEIATIVYTWGESPSGEFSAGYGRHNVDVILPNKIQFGDDKVNFKFEYDEARDIVFGVRTAPQNRSVITMKRKINE